MKKTPVLCLFLCAALFLYAEDKPLRFIELGVEADAAFANSFISVRDIFNKERTFVLDLNKLAEHDLGLMVTAKATVFFNLALNAGLGFGLFTSIKADTVGTLPRTVLSLIAHGNADNQYMYSDTMRLTANVFADMGVRVYKKFGKLKLTALPALFIPLVYMPEPSVVYSVDTRNGLNVNVNASADLYSPVPLESLMNGGGFDINQSLNELLVSHGFDLSFNAEFELSSKLYLGASIINFPLKPALLNYRTRYDLAFSLENEQLLESIMDDTFMKNINDAISDILVEPQYYDNAGYKAIRPIRFDFYTISRPLRRNLVLFKTNIGFSVVNAALFNVRSALTRQFKQPEVRYYFNIGSGVSVHLGRFATLGAQIAYQEQMWHHQFSLGLNLHFIAIDLALSLQSLAPATKEGFLDSIKLNQAKGIGLTFGFRLGI
ncbi:MAG: hypothetical protein LBO67_07190 [Spirochaetaceae bacterium]|nr:hypothetical protein [Spirochaetaceae bacterium]